MGDPVLTLSDHCPVEIALKVNIDTYLTDSNYPFITKPPKLPWNSDIAYKENILQTPEFSYMEKTYTGDQLGIDQETTLLSEVLIEGSLLADNSTLNDGIILKPTLSKCCKHKERKSGPIQNGMIFPVQMHTRV